MQSAYEDAIKLLCSKLFDAYAAAGGDATQTQQADQRCMTGIGLARSSRNHAIALLAQPAAAAGS